MGTEKPVRCVVCELDLSGAYVRLFATKDMWCLVTEIKPFKRIQQPSDSLWTVEAILNINQSKNKTKQK